MCVCVCVCTPLHLLKNLFLTESVLNPSSGREGATCILRACWVGVWGVGGRGGSACMRACVSVDVASARTHMYGFQSRGRPGGLCQVECVWVGVCVGRVWGGWVWVWEGGERVQAHALVRACMCT